MVPPVTVVSTSSYLAAWVKAALIDFMAEILTMSLLECRAMSTSEEISSATEYPNLPMIEDMIVGSKKSTMDGSWP